MGFIKEKIIKPIKLFFIGEKGAIEPPALSRMAFVSYIITVMVLVGAAYPFQEYIFKSFFASITQDLIIAEVNPAREELESLTPLKPHPKLQQAAQMKAEDMIARDYFSHNGPEGERPWAWLNKVDYKYALAGENLAIDYNDPELVTRAWLNSPSHRDNILNGYFTDIGIGVAEGEFDGRESVVVVMFLGREITPTLESIASSETQNSEPVAEPATPSETQDENSSINNIESLEDGDLIKTKEGDDIYITKIVSTGKAIKYYKRIILNPEIFNSYAHLSWNNVKIVEDSVITQLETSQMVMEVYSDGSPVDGNIFVLSSTNDSDRGTKHHLVMSSEDFEKLGYDWNAIYNINHIEASDEFYTLGNAITLESLPSFALIPEFKALLTDTARYAVVAGDSTSSEDMAIIKIFKDKVLKEENDIVASVVNHEALYAVNEPSKIWTYAKNFFLSALSKYTKASLIIFFSILILITGVLSVIKKMGALFFAPRILILIGLISLIVTQL